MQCGGPHKQPWSIVSEQGEHRKRAREGKHEGDPFPAATQRHLWQTPINPRTRGNRTETIIHRRIVHNADAYNHQVPLLSPSTASQTDEDVSAVRQQKVVPVEGIFMACSDVVVCIITPLPRDDNAAPQSSSSEWRGYVWAQSAGER